MGFIMDELEAVTKLTPELVNKTWINSTQHELPHIILVGMTLSLIICVTIVGNILVLLAVYTTSSLRSNTTNYFIVNLAVADTLLGIVVLPFSATIDILGYWPFGAYFCPIWASIDVLCCTASIITLCVISVDRYIGVTRPLKHSVIMSVRKVAIIVLLVWIVSVAISITPHLGWQKKPNNETLDENVCDINTERSYVITSVLVSFYIPSGIIIIIYVRIYKAVARHNDCIRNGVISSHSQRKRQNKSTECTMMVRVHKGGTIREHSPNHSSVGSPERNPSSRLMILGKLKFKREMKAAKTLGIVVGVFLLCWFPFFFLLPLCKYIWGQLRAWAGVSIYRLPPPPPPIFLTPGSRLPHFRFPISTLQQT